MHLTSRGFNLTNGLSALCYKHDEVNKMKVAEGKRGLGVSYRSSPELFFVSNPNFDVEREYGMGVIG